ncbi:hypothetical protein J2X09_005258 [Hydrogenophaga laconesensis]|uniref:Uncharacterized protein n=1 Tax=Hydrogenophaga laconesensis TaxID=1805971 RepID=A0ABU1VJ22_9BURK|nr:hypothetical protein [Hydrogenophaga laconesensis]
MKVSLKKCSLKDVDQPRLAAIRCAFLGVRFVQVHKLALTSLHGGGSLEQLFKLAPVQPNTATLRAVVDLDAGALGDDK